MKLPLPDEPPSRYQALVDWLRKNSVRDGQFRLSHIVLATVAVAAVLAIARSTGVPHTIYLRRIYVAILAFAPIWTYAVAIYCASHSRRRQVAWIAGCGVLILIPLPWAAWYEPGLLIGTLCVLVFETVLLFAIVRAFAKRTPMSKVYSEKYRRFD